MRNSGVFMELAVHAIAYSADTGVHWIGSMETELGSTMATEMALTVASHLELSRELVPATTAQ
jgi:hypothetical protein